MSGTFSKNSMKKGFKAPIMKDNERASPGQVDSDQRKKEKKKEKERASLEQMDSEQGKKEKKKDQNNKKQEKDRSTSNNENKHSEVLKQQVSLSDSQYEDLFDAVIKGSRSTSSSQHDNERASPGQMDIEQEKKFKKENERASLVQVDSEQGNKEKKKEKERTSSEQMLVSSRKKKRQQVSLSDSQYEDLFDAVIKGSRSTSCSQHNTPNEEILAVADGKCKLSTPSSTTKEEHNKYKLVPTTPAQKSKVLSQVSPWGSHFTKQPSQGSSILKELQETQSSLLNSSSLLSSSSPSSSSNSSSKDSVCSTHLSHMYVIPQKQPQEDQRKHLEELQSHRNVGVWVFCCRETCQKQRYLAHITDPQDVPEVWFCNMNPDKKYNSCQCEEQLPSPEEEEDMIENSFTAGSVVWARVPGYPWWPAIVDDDPDLAQYYWVLEDLRTVTHYHVVFFDDGPVTRAWVDLKSISPFGKNNNKFKQRTCRGIDFSRRIQEAQKQANNALTLSSYKRLTVYSFIVRYKGPITTSEQKVQNTMKKYKLKSKKGIKTSQKLHSKKGNESNKDDYETLDTKKNYPQEKQGSSSKRKYEVKNFEKCSVGPNRTKRVKLDKSKKISMKNKKEISNGKSHKCIFNTTNVCIEGTLLTEENDAQGSKLKSVYTQQSEEFNDERNVDKQSIIQSESETPSFIEDSRTNKLHAICLPGPSQQIGKDISDQNCGVQSGSETPSLIDGIDLDKSVYQPENINMKDTVGLVEHSEMVESSQGSKHSFSQSTIAEFLAAECDEAIVPELSSFSQSSHHSLPFEE